MSPTGPTGRQWGLLSVQRHSQFRTRANCAEQSAQGNMGRREEGRGGEGRGREARGELHQDAAGIADVPPRLQRRSPSKKPEHGGLPRRWRLGWDGLGPADPVTGAARAIHSNSSVKFRSRPTAFPVSPCAPPGVPETCQNLVPHRPFFPPLLAQASLAHPPSIPHPSLSPVQ